LPKASATAAAEWLRLIATVYGDPRQMQFYTKITF
jgi:hypothetical protein